MDFSEIIVKKSDMKLDPVTFGRECCLPCKGFGPAVRTYWLLHYVVRGKGRLERGGKRHDVQKGDIFVIPPFEETYYEADRDDPWEYIWIGFSADGNCANLFENAVLRVSGIGALFEDMCRCNGMENGKFAFLCGKLWELFAYLQESSHPIVGHIEKALSLIHSQYADRLSVADIAARLNLERTYFSALFKRTVGVSAVEYLTTVRLDKAAELLRLGETPTTVSISVGYADYCHFSKAFKKRFGCSPSRYGQQ